MTAESAVGAAARRQELTPALRESIARGKEHLLALQRPDGHWRSVLETDVSITAEFLLACRHLDRVDDDRERRMVNYLSSRQHADGTWRIHPSGPPMLDTTIKAHAALKAAGVPADDARLRRSRAFILDSGGVEASAVFTKIHLAIVGEMSWDTVPVIPPEMMLLPRSAPFNVYEMSYWCRAIMVPLSIVQSIRPAGHFPRDRGVSDLFRSSEGRHRANLQRGRDWFSWKRFFWLLDRALKGIEPLNPKELRRRALERAERWMLQHLDHSDGLGAIHPGMLNTVHALRALMYDWEHPVLAKAWTDLLDLGTDEGDGWFMQPCLSPVWDTALGMIALQQAGCEPQDGALLRAADWLLDHRATITSDWKHKAPHAHAGAWAFQYKNDHYPDVDDTAMVLMALRRAGTTDPAAKAHACETAMAWARGMQSRNGGWGAFDRNNDRTLLLHVPFADHGALLDVPTADLTGRMLELLGTFGVERSEPAIKRALAFLRREQEPEGSWFGRWGCNYLYGTWSVLAGLEAIGLPQQDPLITRSAAWLEKMQNSDGGWGETCESYVDRTLMGRGVSTASQTAWALLGLMAAGRAASPALLRGADYLLRTQDADGGWRETEWTGTGFPGVLYLKYNLYPVAFPLQALGGLLTKGV